MNYTSVLIQLTRAILEAYIALAAALIVNKEEQLGSPANIKGANKDAKIYVGRSTTVQNLLFCAHTLCMSYVTNTFLLVSVLVRSKQLLHFVHGQGQKSEQKPTTKNFVGFHNHSPPLTMLRSVRTITNSGQCIPVQPWHQVSKVVMNQDYVSTKLDIKQFEKYGTVVFIVFSHGITAVTVKRRTYWCAINPVGVELFSYVNNFVPINVHGFWRRGKHALASTSATVCQMSKVLYQTFTQTLSFIQGFRSFERVQQSKFSISCTNLNKRTILRCG